MKSLWSDLTKEVTADLFVAAELRRVEQGAVVKQLGDQLGAAHPGVAVGVGDQSGQSCHHQHLDDGVVAQTGGFTFEKDTEWVTGAVRGQGFI